MEVGMRAGTRFARVLGKVAVFAAVAAIPANAHVSSSTASKANCPLTAQEGQHLGASYVDPFKAKGISCSKAENVIKDFNKCRKSNGGADGRCNSSVDGFSCDEGKRTGSDFQYFADVVCKNGSKKIKFHYTQNT
jgi:hypothetical protein